MLYRSGGELVNLHLHGSGLDERKAQIESGMRGGPKTKKSREPHRERTSVRMYSLGRIVGFGGRFLLFMTVQRGQRSEARPEVLRLLFSCTACCFCLEILFVVAEIRHPRLPVHNTNMNWRE
jgi:hypothetical protein